jgi:hypothetical protein
MIGLQTFRKYLLEITWKRYQESIPDLLKQIRTIQKERRDQLEAIQMQISTLDKNKLRSIASSYVSDFCQYLVGLLGGSLEANPTISGQTLNEEQRASCKQISE